MNSAYVVAAALVAAVVAGYGLAEPAQLSQPDVPAPAQWSLPPVDTADLAQARQRLAQARAWQSPRKKARSEAADGQAEPAKEAASDGRAWGFHGVVIAGAERTALITTGEGEVLRLRPGERLPNGARLAAIGPDAIEVEAADGQRRFRLYRQQ